MVPASDGIEPGLGTGFLGEDGGRGLGPHERFRLCVVAHQIVIDGLLQFDDAREYAAPLTTRYSPHPIRPLT